MIITELARKLSTVPSHIQGTLSLVHAVRLKAAVMSRDPEKTCLAVMSIPALRNGCVEILAKDNNRMAVTMNGRKHNKSELMKKDFESLRTVDFDNIVSEFKCKFPELFQQVTRLMNCTENEVAYQKAIPRLTMVYSIIMFTRNQELSKVQRLMSVCYNESLCEQSVYDRGNRLGINLCYSSSLDLVEVIGEEYLDVLVRALGEDKVLRFIADNIDFHVGVHKETKERHKHLVHMTGCAALINENYFSDLASTPEIPLDQLTIDDILLKPAEYKIIRKEVVKQVVDNVVPHIPSLQFLKEAIPDTYEGPESHKYVHKTKVVPMEVLNYNSQQYQGTVKILDNFENILSEVHKKRGDAPKTYQTGGDQLTRDRFSGAKLLRLGNENAAARFDHLMPITFEFLHLGFNFLEKAIFKPLYNDKGISEVGTLKAEVTRCFRNDFNTDATKAYAADRDFVMDYTAGLQVEAVKHFFGIDDVNCGPTKNAPPNFSSKKQKKEWVYNTIGEIIDLYIFPCWTGKSGDPAITIGIILAIF